MATQRLLTTLMGQRPAKVVATRYNMEVGVRVDYSCQKLLRGNYFHISRRRRSGILAHNYYFNLYNCINNLLLITLCRLYIICSNTHITILCAHRMHKIGEVYARRVHYI